MSVPATASSLPETAPARPRKIRLGDLLIEHRLITAEQLQSALAEQKVSGHKLGRVLVDKAYLDQEQLLDFLARQLNVPHVDLRRFQLRAETVTLIPEPQARRFRVIALSEGKEGLLIGMADPTDVVAYDELARVLKRPLSMAVVNEQLLLKSLDLFYRRTSEITGLAQELTEELSQYDVDIQKISETEDVSLAPVVKLIQSVFEDAVQVGASDVHIEPGEKDLRVRFRQDGVLRVQSTAEKRIGPAVISRLKLMANLDISEKRLPQDGRFQLKLRDKGIDVRLSTLPLPYGESAVMRLLNQSSGIRDLDQSGMRPELLERFRKAVHQPNGLVLVTGPTGSGKTTTLYGALKEINDPGVKIITAEDPIEYRIPGLCQVQINAKIDLSFARVLRTVLRQDPDIVLIGEMRDRETAEIGLRAAMTGHLVLSTLHTNDAISTPARLLDMGLAPFLLASSLRGILAQRLMRKVCGNCAEPQELTPAHKLLVLSLLGEGGLGRPFRSGKGCNYCHGSGYLGRIGIHEFLEMDDELAMALQHTDARVFVEAAKARPGFVTLRHSAMQYALDGMTTLDQVMHVTAGNDG